MAEEKKPADSDQPEAGKEPEVAAEDVVGAQSTPDEAQQDSEKKAVEEPVAEKKPAFDPSKLGEVAGSRYATASVNVRTGPGTSYDVRRTIAVGDEVSITDVEVDGWRQVRRASPVPRTSASLAARPSRQVTSCMFIVAASVSRNRGRSQVLDRAWRSSLQLERRPRCLSLVGRAGFCGGREGHRQCAAHVSSFGEGAEQVRGASISCPPGSDRRAHVLGSTRNFVGNEL